MIEQACQLYPQIRDHIDFIDIGTPITNTHYLGSPHGEIYGLDHSKHRMSPEVNVNNSENCYWFFLPLLSTHSVLTLLLIKKENH